jgi:hypothetical protein
MTPPITATAVDAAGGEPGRQPSSASRERPMIIASIMRLEGPTGVQAYVRAVLAASRGHAARMTFASPFQLGRILVYGTFAWGPLLRVVSTSASVWW